MQQLENDLDQTQEKLMNANQRLEEKEKALQNVSHLQTNFTNLGFFSLFPKKIIQFGQFYQFLGQLSTNLGPILSIFGTILIRPRKR